MDKFSLKKGEVPVAYIIALILGIAVVAILGYWFFVVQNQGGVAMNLEQCRSSASRYCTMWRDNGYALGGDNAPELGIVNGGQKWFSVADTNIGVAAYVTACSSFPVLTTHITSDLRMQCESLLTGA